MHIVIVTGLSGAGKSTALRALEDHGFYTVDNMPLPMTTQLLDWMNARGEPIEGVALSSGQAVERMAISVGARQHQYLGSFADEIQRLRDAGHRVDVLFLDASDEQLVRRFSATRRRHPLSDDDLVAGIQRNREILADLRDIADIIDTDALNVHQLKGLIQDRYGAAATGIAVMLLSFGFKHGLPRESNLVFDVRFLPNPYFVSELTARDGRDPEVAEYVVSTGKAGQMLDHIEGLLRFALPEFERERKLYLTVAIGCTGGRHRSVALVEALRRRLGSDWDVVVKHRDLDVRG